jgi:hypothetical protein
MGAVRVERRKKERKGLYMLAGGLGGFFIFFFISKDYETLIGWVIGLVLYYI